MIRRQATGSPILPHWTEGLHPAFREVAPQVVVDDGVRLHGYVAALNSSMAFAFNLFLAFRIGDPSSLARLLGGLTDRRLVVERVVFEYAGPTHILGEVAGAQPARDEHVTASDVAVFVRDETGRRGVILIEVKLSEGGFTTCGGAASRGNRRQDVCASAQRFLADPSACYLRRPLRATRERRYWPIFEGAHGAVKTAFPGCGGEGPCPFRGGAQQIMRNHALLLGLEQEGLVDFGAFVLVHHDANPDVVPVWDAYAAMAADPARLFRLPASAVAWAAGEALSSDPAIGGWLAARYLLPARAA
jgi:hypothetical protein